MSKCLICNEKEGTQYSFADEIIDKAFPPGKAQYNQGYKIARKLTALASFCPDCLAAIQRKRKTFWGSWAWAEIPEGASPEKIASVCFAKKKSKIYTKRLEKKSCEVCGAEPEKEITIDYFIRGYQQAIIAYRCAHHPFSDARKSNAFRDIVAEFNASLESGESYYHERKLKKDKLQKK